MQKGMNEAREIFSSKRYSKMQITQDKISLCMSEQLLRKTRSNKKYKSSIKSNGT